MLLHNAARLTITLRLFIPELPPFWASGRYLNISKVTRWPVGSWSRSLESLRKSLSTSEAKSWGFDAVITWVYLGSMVKLSVLFVATRAWSWLRSNLRISESIPRRPPLGSFRIIELRIVVVRPAFPQCKLIFVGAGTRNSSFTSNVIVFSIIQFRLKLKLLGLVTDGMNLLIRSRTRILRVRADSFHV